MGLFDFMRDKVFTTPEDEFDQAVYNAIYGE